MADRVNPNDFVISRKRKKYKFALFHNNPLCFQAEEWAKRSIDVVELGAGTALFLVELASRYPEREFVAIDVKADRLQKGAYEAVARKLDNISFVRARADQLDQLVPAHSVTSLWLTFPDPFPRDRSANRRMTHPKFLTIYKNLLRPEGSLLLKHDNRDFFEWSIEQLKNEKWKIIEQSSDLHKSDLSDDYKIKTTYEIRWLDKGLVTNILNAVVSDFRANKSDS